MSLPDKLREEIIESQKSQASFARGKLLLVAGIGAASLGILPATQLSVRTMSLLALLPFVCLYVDTLCYHSGIRVMTIAKYFRTTGTGSHSSEDPIAAELAAVRDYEQFCRNHRHQFGLEGVALLLVSLVLSALVIAIGIGVWLPVSWMPDPFPASVSSRDRAPLAGLLIISGAIGFVACALSYAAHRARVDYLDHSESRIDGVKRKWWWRVFGVARS